jgi:hypothetical protein
MAYTVALGELLQSEVAWAHILRLPSSGERP